MAINLQELRNLEWSPGIPVYVSMEDGRGWQELIPVYGIDNHWDKIVIIME